jgi:hypothetical protein
MNDRADWAAVAVKAWDNPAWAKAAREYHASRGQRILEVEHDKAGLAQGARAASSTIDALVFGLRERGVSALEETAVQRRLSAVNRAQLMHVAGCLQKLQSDIARVWSADEVEALMRKWSALR